MSDDAPPAEAEPLRLDHFLKINSLVASGGHAKLMIQGGEIKVNGEVETRRRKKLSPGDVVEVDGRRLTIANTPTGV
ncbi:MAG TPA: RNA-binding S4 domain-containing protein [Planctomycetaceae bacterium]|nr:RNA-binding S4 domain-containing protein [Planctomycetaceae bacterium]